MSKRIKKLRGLLDARGIQWYRGGDELTRWDVEGLNFAAAALWPINDETQTKIIVHVSGLTPEQAVSLSPERTCRNITDWHPSDEFICSECGFACVISESVDDLEYEYEPRYCPDCGARVLSKISDSSRQDASEISDPEALQDVMVSKVAYSASFGTDRKEGIC